MADDIKYHLNQKNCEALSLAFSKGISEVYDKDVIVDELIFVFGSMASTAIALIEDKNAASEQLTRLIGFLIEANKGLLTHSCLSKIEKPPGEKLQ